MTSNYGEGFVRPTIFTISAIIGASLFFYFGGYETDSWNALERTGRALNPTFSLPESGTDSEGVPKPLTAVDYLLKVIFLPITATLFISFQTKIGEKV